MHPCPSPSCRLQPARTGLVMIALMIGLFVAMFAVNPGFADPLKPEAPGSIAGVVRDHQGAPLSGIKIRVFQGFSTEWYPIREVTTTVTGAYKVPILATGLYRIQASDPVELYGSLYYPQSPSLQGATDVPVAGNHVTNLDLTLAPAARITGVVTILDEMVATNGQVSVYTQVGKQWTFVSSHAITTTGVYTVAPLPAGTFRLCVTTYLGQDFFTGCYDAAAQIEKATDVTVGIGETKANLNIVIGQGQYNGAMTGLVSADGIGLPNIRVNLYRSYVLGQPLVYTMTNATGHYTFGGLSDGAYVLEFFDPAGVYALTYHDNQRYGGTVVPIQLEKGATISGINISLIKGGAIRGTIRSNNGFPVSNLPIMLGYNIITYGGYEMWVWNIDHTRTDENGQYLIQRLWPDRYWICVGVSVSFYQDCYGTGTPGSAENQGIPVTGGTTTPGIDIIFGPDFTLYLPTVAR